MSLTPPILIVLLLLSTPTAAHQSIDGIGVERYVELQPGGVLFINDTITLRAATITALYIGQPEGWREEKATFQLHEAEGWKPLEFEALETEGVRWFVIHLPAADGGLYRLRASYLYANEVEWGDGNYLLEIPLYPALADDPLNPTDWNITHLTFRAYLPEGSELLDVDSPLSISNSTMDGRGLLSLISENSLDALQPIVAAIEYTPSPSEGHPIRIESMEVRMRIGWGIGVEEDYTIINMDGNLEKFHVDLPRGARNIRAYDRAGPLKVSSRIHDNGVDVYIHPRSTVRVDERWSFTLRYTLPKRGLITGTKSRYRLIYNLTHPPCYISQASIEVQLPDGGIPTAHQPEGEVRRSSYLSYRVSIPLGEVAPLERAAISIDYRWTSFWLLLRPMLWSFLIAAISALILIPVRRRREVEVEEKPTMLEEFLELYDRRIGLLVELEELEGELERKEIGRERFERESAETHRRLMELSRRLKRLEARLMEERPELSEELEELRKAEEELEGIMTAIRSLERRLRRRRISRRDYLARRREHIELRRKAIRRIEEAIAALRGQPRR